MSSKNLDEQFLSSCLKKTVDAAAVLKISDADLVVRLLDCIHSKYDDSRSVIRSKEKAVIKTHSPKKCEPSAGP